MAMAGHKACTPKTAPSCALQVAELWADYFVFTVTRNPFSRAASQYRTGLLSNVAEPAECAALVSWARHACGAWPCGQPSHFDEVTQLS